MAAEDGALVGLRPEQRYRCGGCGNVTRFDVEVSERSRRYWHADLSGAGRLESEQRETTVLAVRCRWCGSTDVGTEPRPSVPAAATRTAADPAPPSAGP